MSNFIAAIQFITIIPMGKPREFNPEGMVPYFPVVGILLGILVAVFDQLVIRLWSVPVASILDVIFLVIVTGAFHLDGLGDTADGLYGPRDRNRALTIMKDSRIGTMGLVAIICGLSIKWAGIASLESHRSLILIIVPAYARASILFGMRFLKYARTEGGTGEAFFNKIPGLIAFRGLLLPVFLSTFFGWKCVLINIAFILIVVGVLFYYKRKMSGITGDMLGALTEITEAGLFLAISIGGFS